MVLGVLAVAAIYIAMNMTYVYAMPLTEIAKHDTIAHAAAAQLFSPGAAVWLSAMIALSCFSAAATARCRAHACTWRWRSMEFSSREWRRFIPSGGPRRSA